LFKPQHSPRASGRAIARIPIDAIRPNPIEPRRRTSPESVQQLAESIRRHGQLSPVLVRRAGDGYELIAGQRRIKALKLLGRTQAEAVVLSTGDCDSALIALVENMQREDLNYLDEAEACRRILDSYPTTQERLAASLSVSPSTLANRLRLLKLPQPVLDLLRASRLTERHARALLPLCDDAAQLALARRAADQRLSVKQLEALVRREGHARAAQPAHTRHSLLVRDMRIVVNAFEDTARQLERIGVRLSHRVETLDDCVEIVITVPCPQPSKPIEAPLPEPVGPVQL